LLAAYLSGVAGNITGILIYPEHHQALGASGMVMGALGLLATESLASWRNFPYSRKIFLRALAAAVLVLVLIGFSPGTDIVAHIGGFVAGAIFGLALSLIRPEALQASVASMSCGMILLVCVILSWWKVIA
jgi:membrane associated rhomboid family serine protease